MNIVVKQSWLKTTSDPGRNFFEIVQSKKLFLSAGSRNW